MQPAPFQLFQLGQRMNLRNWVFALARGRRGGRGSGSAEKDVCVRETQMKTNVSNVKLDGNACALSNHLHHHQDNMYIIHINVHETAFSVAASAPRTAWGTYSPLGLAPQNVKIISRCNLVFYWHQSQRLPNRHFIKTHRLTMLDSAFRLCVASSNFTLYASPLRR